MSARPTRVGAPPGARHWMHYFGEHGRSFRFAAMLLPKAERSRIATIYTWCRYTDDLVDRSAEGVDECERRLEEWLVASRAAYDGRHTGVPIIDRAMQLARESDVPFTYPAELIAAMRMDLYHRPYETLDALQLYTWRAAGVVGLWLATTYGVREPACLERAAALGQAMQLTNIIRDIGEDLRRGRLYVPLSLLRAHALDVTQLESAAAGRAQLDHRWVALLEELMAVAERDYAFAAEAFPVLPPAFRRTVAVASAVYRGIHDAVRRLDYRTLNRRAATTLADKVALGARALLDLRATARAASEPRPCAMRRMLRRAA